MTANDHVRIRWPDLPPVVRARVESIIGGGPVVETLTQSGGFSPGTAERVRTADGRRAFIKAVNSAISASATVIARRELRITAAMPIAAPVPRVLGGFEEEDDWVVLVLEDIKGRQPGNPWTPEDLDSALIALDGLAVALTPAPLPDVPRVLDSYWAEDFDSWRLIEADPPADLDPWAAANLPLLKALAARGPDLVRDGETLVHADIRADNLLVRADGSTLVVDWPHAVIGPAWLDRVLLAMNVIFCGGDPEPALRGLDADAVLAIVSGATGAFLHTTRLPPPPATPAVWPFARRQADAWLAWLKRELSV